MCFGKLLGTLLDSENSIQNIQIAAILGDCWRGFPRNVDDGRSEFDSRRRHRDARRGRSVRYLGRVQRVVRTFKACIRSRATRGSDLAFRQDATQRHSQQQDHERDRNRKLHLTPIIREFRRARGRRRWPALDRSIPDASRGAVQRAGASRRRRFLQIAACVSRGKYDIRR